MKLIDKRPAPTSRPSGPHTRKWILNVASLGAASLAHADVNIIEAAYYKTWIDFEISTPVTKYAFQRTYRSRSLHHGLFGLGWCTDFEKTLCKISQTQLVLRDCTLDLALVFNKQNKDYVALKDSKDRIIFKDGKYWRSLPDGRTQSYDAGGRLLAFTDRRQQNFELERSASGSLIKVQINRGITITFEKTILRTGELVQVRAPGTAAFFYHLKNRNLESVRQKGEFLYQYGYDHLHNLTEIKVTGQTQETMKYNPQQDWLIQHTGPDHCETRWVYEQEREDFFEVRQTQTCPQRRPQLLTYQVFLKTNRDGTKSVDRVRTTPLLRQAASTTKGI